MALERDVPCRGGGSDSLWVVTLKAEPQSVLVATVEFHR
jgi:hypothetical protein